MNLFIFIFAETLSKRLQNYDNLENMNKYRNE